ncbi:MAG: lysophospholipid acyltransferase family protein [Deinococcales bacterium]
MTKPKPTQCFKHKLQKSIEIIATFFTPYLVDQSLRQKIYAIYVKGDFNQLATGAALLVPNHHSWWDAFLLWRVMKRLKRPFHAIMDDKGLAQFPFFKHLGVISHKDIRQALRLLQGGEVLVLFPEGALRPAAKVTEIHRGLSYFAQKSTTPIHPLAIRTVMRGADKPEILLLLGSPLKPDQASNFISVMNDLLETIDQDLAQSNPEAPPQGYDIWQTAPLRWDIRLGQLFKPFRSR